MIFNKHSNLLAQHAFLSPSKYHWINYDDEKLDRAFSSAMAAQRGTELHAFAHDAIRLGVHLRGDKKTLSMYVNDAIGFRMSPEQVLYYSENCFGTCDAISFKRGKLRIHDLKTGIARTSESQLEVYAALFCLEYDEKPFEIDIELRVYQSNEVRIYETDPEDISLIMSKIISFDKRIRALKMEAML